MLRRVSLIAAAALLLSGCWMYSFTGGGLPRHIRTIAIVPFDNTTAEAGLSSDIYAQLLAQLPRRLNVRVVDERVADAVVRGRVISVSERPPVVRPGQQQNDQFTTITAQVDLTVEVEIFDIRESRPIWQNSSLVVSGEFSPEGNQTRMDGQRVAIERLADRILEGAQSQW
jgi:hypothetical protein